MPPFELTDAGLGTNTQAENRANLFERLQLLFGGDLDEATESNVGQLTDIVSEFMSVYEQATLGVYGSFDPASARGAALDARAALTGSRRRAAYPSTVVVSVKFSSAGTINNGDTIKHTDADGVETLWEAYGGPYESAGPWPETLAVSYQCQDVGPIAALAGTDWAEVDPIAGLSGDADALQSATDATLGELTETDVAFRLRRQREIFASGNGPLGTINGRVSRVVGVTKSRAYHNPATPGVDANGIPWKAFNVVVRTNPNPPDAALQQQIWDAIFSALGAGGQAYGTDYAGTSIDSEGNSHAVAFDILTDVLMEVRITLTTSTSEIAVTPNLNTIVAAAVLAKAKLAHEVSGRDVLAWDYASVVGSLVDAGLITGVDGVLAEVKATVDGAWVTTKRVISIREIAAFDSSRITVSQV